MHKLLALVTALIVIQPVEATTLLPADFTAMVTESQVIVHGRITQVRGELNSRRAIESLVTLQVQSALKGPAGAELQFRVPGGRVGRYRRIFVGAPSFALGDEVVLFLKSRPPAIATPYGLSQGVYRVTRASGVPVVVPVLATAAVIGTGRGDPARTPLPLDAFARQVRLVLERR